MKVIYVRVDEGLYEQLKDLADLEAESVSLIVRRLLRRGLRADVQDVHGLVRAHEGTGRVR